jgi:hypothetical protein
MHVKADAFYSACSLKMGTCLSGNSNSTLVLAIKAFDESIKSKDSKSR